jgi:hypothetical protein
MLDRTASTTPCRFSSFPGHSPANIVIWNMGENLTREADERYHHHITRCVPLWPSNDKMKSQLKQRRQPMFVQRKTEAHWRIIAPVEKKLSITYISLCVCVRARLCVAVCSLAYPASNAYAPYYDVVCGPSDSTAFFDIFS